MRIDRRVSHDLWGKADVDVGELTGGKGVDASVVDEDQVAVLYVIVHVVDDLLRLSRADIHDLNEIVAVRRLRAVKRAL